MATTVAFACASESALRAHRAPILRPTLKHADTRWTLSCVRAAATHSGPGHNHIIVSIVGTSIREEACREGRRV